MNVTPTEAPSTPPATGDPAPLEAAEIAELWREYVARRDPTLRDRLVSRYTPLVKAVIARLAIPLPAVADADDLLSHGLIGLLHAIDRFDPARGVKFETFAYSRVRGAIVDALRALDPLSRAGRDQGRALAVASIELRERLGRSPTDEELAAHLGITVERLRRRSVETSFSFVSLDSLLGQDDDPDAPGHERALEDVESLAPPEVAERRELLGLVAGGLKRLPERERLVLALHYAEDLTIHEIARVLGVSEPRANQLRAQAIQRLRAQVLRQIAGGR